MARKNALDYVLGYTCANDASDRLATEEERRSVESWEDFRFVLPSWPIPGDPQRNSRSK